MVTTHPRSASTQLTDVRTLLRILIEAAEALDGPLLEASQAKAREDIGLTGKLYSTGLSVELKKLRNPLHALLTAAKHVERRMSHDRPPAA